jgi:hypothetical protein
MWAGALRVVRGERFAVDESEVIRDLGVGAPCGRQGAARGTAQRCVEGVARATVGWLRAALAVDAPAARVADEVASRRKSARALLQKWAELAARAGPGAAGILARGRAGICEAVSSGIGGGSPINTFPAAVIRYAPAGGGHTTCPPSARQVPGGSRACSTGVALSMRARWERCREDAHEAAQADGGGEGWLLALTFAQWRVASGGNKDRWRAAGEAEGGDARAARSGRLELRQALVTDSAWRRAVAAHLRGRCGDARAEICRIKHAARLEQNRAKRRSDLRTAQAGLLHWGVSGTLLRKCQGVAGLGVPAGDDGSDGVPTPAFRLVIRPAATAVNKAGKRASGHHGGRRSEPSCKCSARPSLEAATFGLEGIQR